MMMQREPFGMFCTRSYCPPCCFGRVDDLRRAQVVRDRVLALVEAELREVVVHVRRRPRRGLLLVARLGILLHLLELFRRVVLLVDVLRPFERRVGGVAPEALEIGLAVRRPRRLVRLGAGLRGCSGGGFRGRGGGRLRRTRAALLIGGRARGQPHHGGGYGQGAGGYPGLSGVEGTKSHVHLLLAGLLLQVTVEHFL
jgi:hypothetical protein